MLPTAVAVKVVIAEVPPMFRVAVPALVRVFVTESVVRTVNVPLFVVAELIASNATEPVPFILIPAVV